jgi:hypothetical protein
MWQAGDKIGTHRIYLLAAFPYKLRQKAPSFVLRAGKHLSSFFL